MIPQLYFLVITIWFILPSKQGYALTMWWYRFSEYFMQSSFGSLIFLSRNVIIKDCYFYQERLSSGTIFILSNMQKKVNKPFTSSNSRFHYSKSYNRGTLRPKPRNTNSWIVIPGDPPNPERAILKDTNAFSQQRMNMVLLVASAQTQVFSAQTSVYEINFNVWASFEGKTLVMDISVLLRKLLANIGRNIDFARAKRHTFYQIPLVNNRVFWTHSQRTVGRSATRRTYQHTPKAVPGALKQCLAVPTVDLQLFGPL